MNIQLQPLYIFDLDGTLSLADHRRYLVEAPACPACKGYGNAVGHGGDIRCPVCAGSGKERGFKPNWDAFYDACDQDAPNTPVIETMERLRLMGCEIRIFSGRSDRVRGKTIKWLFENTNMHITSFRNDMLVMRKEGDFTPDDQLKESWLKALPMTDRERLIAVFDDRAKVVNMWRRNGVACFQVAEGNF